MFKQYINGKLVDGKGREMPVYNPATGKVIDSVGCADATQTKEALIAAAEAFKTWSKTSVNERAAWLYKLKEACTAERDYLIELVSSESGRPYAAACGDVDWLLTSLSFYAEDAKDAYKAVLKGAGASKVRDAVDRRIVKEVKRGTATYRGSVNGLPGIIDSENDVM